MNSVISSVNADNIKPAPAWRRIAAIIYDSILLLALFFFSGFIKVAIVTSIKNIGINVNESIENLLFFCFLLSITILFYYYFWSKAKQTLGMKAWKLYIKSCDNSPLKFIQCVTRILVAIPAILLCFIGIIWCHIDKQSRSWQDIASSTVTFLVP